MSADGLRILFQGDSLTDGNRYKDPSQAWDKNHQIGHSYAFVVNAILGLHYPERNFEFINRGISGNTTLDILNRIQTDIIDLKPDVLSLYIGVNDGSHSEQNPQGTSPELFEKRVRLLLDQVREALPQIRLMLIAPYIYERSPMTAEYAHRMELVHQYPAILKKLSDEYHAVYIELQPAFDEACRIKPVSYWCWDGVHATENGHGLIAKKWMEGFSEMLGLED